jgi:hypothetical protein
VSETEPEMCEYCAIADAARSRKQDRRTDSLGIRIRSVSRR